MFFIEIKRNLHTIASVAHSHAFACRKTRGQQEAEIVGGASRYESHILCRWPDSHASASDIVVAWEFF